MKNPNGYGSVVKLSGNRRNPFCVRKTIGWNEKGHPVYKTIGYYPTREAGMIALAEYNKSPWDIDAERMTLGELFELWKKKKMHKLGESSQRNLVSKYKYLEQLQNVKYKDLRAIHMQETIDLCPYGYSTKNFIKVLWGHLDNFAYEIDLVGKKYSDLIRGESIPETSRKPFTDAELSMLWESASVPWVDSVLILLYTGFRISEFLGIKREEVNIEDWYITGGVKTSAGKNRIVPIHSRIRPLILERYNQGHKYLITSDGSHMSRSTYLLRWTEIMKNHGMDHVPHECRHTLETRLDSANANRRCIDLIIGHKSKDVGNRVYNHKTIEQLKEAIEKID